MTDVALVVRRAETDDWPKLRAIRLEALSDSPEAFGSTYGVALKLSNYQWRAMVERSLYFLAERDGNVDRVREVQSQAHKWDREPQ